MLWILNLYCTYSEHVISWIQIRFSKLIFFLLDSRFLCANICKQKLLVYTTSCYVIPNFVSFAIFHRALLFFSEISTRCHCVFLTVWSWLLSGSCNICLQHGREGNTTQLSPPLTLSIVDSIKPHCALVMYCVDDAVLGVTS